MDEDEEDFEEFYPEYEAPYEYGDGWDSDYY